MKTMVSTAGAASLAPDGLLSGAKAGPWVVERELGRGGMGSVYAVIHEEIGKRAALKVVHARLLGPGFNADRMLLEAKVVNQVGHPNIVDIFDTGTLADGRPYIVMERLAGQPLSVRADESKLDPDQVIAILLQVCDALIAAHAAGVIHRDLKLDNVFLVDNPDDPATPRVKLLDWGIAKVIDRDANRMVRHTIDGQLVGTPQYLSPEQARGADVSPQSDVYSLGVMAYELFLEQLPFEAETSAEIMVMHLRATPPPPHELWPAIPVQLEALILTMLAKDPAHRPTMLEVAHALEAARRELAQRRAAALAVVTIVPRTTRAPSAAGLAPTEIAHPPLLRRWQYAVGGLALVASGLAFIASPPARARPRPGASTTATSYARTDTALAADRAAPPEPAPAVRPLAAEPIAERPRVDRRHARSSSPRRAPATPRRSPAMLDDPDGTIDPYR